MTWPDRLLLLTDRRACEQRGRSLAETVGAAVAAGIRAVVLREKDLEPARRRALGAELAELLDRVGGILIVASDARLAVELGAGHVHLAAADPGVPALPGRLVGRSCHDPASLRAAAEEKASYATLSPVFPTRSKPGYGPPLGVAGLAEALARPPGLPVYALGGVDAATAGTCLRAGAAGVAVMGAVMDAWDPEAAAHDLVTVMTATAPGPSRQVG